MPSLFETCFRPFVSLLTHLSVLALEPRISTLPKIAVTASLSCSSFSNSSADTRDDLAKSISA